MKGDVASVNKCMGSAVRHYLPSAQFVQVTVSGAAAARAVQFFLESWSLNDKTARVPSVMSLSSPFNDFINTRRIRRETLVCRLFLWMILR